MSATLPARLGEPSRALIVARRRAARATHLPVVLGTIVSQTLLNILALVILGVVMFSTVDLFTPPARRSSRSRSRRSPSCSLVLAAPALLRSGQPSRFGAGAPLARAGARRARPRARAGCASSASRGSGATATVAQLGAWAIQWLSCYVLLVALGLDDRAGIGAAAAVLFAVNVTAVLPATPSNLGVFQAACVAVLTGAYGVGAARRARLRDHPAGRRDRDRGRHGHARAASRRACRWRDVRLRALHAAPVSLSASPGQARPGQAREAEA